MPDCTSGSWDKTCSCSLCCRWRKGRRRGLCEFGHVVVIDTVTPSANTETSGLPDPRSFGAEICTPENRDRVVVPAKMMITASLSSFSYKLWRDEHMICQSLWLKHLVQSVSNYIRNELNWQRQNVFGLPSQWLLPLPVFQKSASKIRCGFNIVQSIKQRVYITSHASVSSQCAFLQ